MVSDILNLPSTGHLSLLAGLICLVAYGSLIVGILRSNVQQSFAAFLLWGMLDTIATVTTILQHGNFWLPLSNALGSASIALLLFVKRQMYWSWFETITSILVILCLTIWHISGEKAGIVASSVAVVIASFPQMADTYRKPWATPVGSYMIFLCANILSFIAGRHWTIEEKFYPGCSVFLCVAIIALTRKKNKPENQ